MVLNTKTRQLFVKLCNASADSRTATIDLSRFKGVKTAAVKTTISGSPDDENNYDAQPIAPVTENVKVKKQMNVDVKPYSFTMFTINL